MPITSIDPQDPEFHLQIKQIRAEHKLSQEKFALVLDVDKRTILLWEKPLGERSSRPRGETLDRLRAFLSGKPMPVAPMKITLAEAKQMLAYSLGVEESAIEITVKY